MSQLRDSCLFSCDILLVMPGAGAPAAAKERSAPATCWGSSSRWEQPPGEGQQGSVWHFVSPESPAAGGAHHQVTQSAPQRCASKLIDGISFWCFKAIFFFFFFYPVFRKLLEQREEELQQQVRSLRLREASLNRTNTELSHRVQQLDTRLSILEAELDKAREEVRKPPLQLIRIIVV